MADKEHTSEHFIKQIIRGDHEAGLHGGRVGTRFPPEPNGYLHLGHAKSICLNFGIAEAFGGTCNLRFDDTNPDNEDVEYVDGIREDVAWLGFSWTRECYASDYFSQLYEYALKLVDAGQAYVCDLNMEQIREYRGTLTEPGRPCPGRERSPEENRRLFTAMREGAFADGEKVLRAKIDMAHPNFNMRDPVMYRIKRARHDRTGDCWPIYPSYDFAHGQSDSIENITHSLCTLEFREHRPLYEWFIQQLGIFPSRQIEFARLNLSYTLMSKRKLLQLVREKHVDGWDDPRLPTLRGLRRRGYPAEAIRDFCDTIGITTYNGLTDIALLEHAVRNRLNQTARRVMAVLDPLKVTLVNFDDATAHEVEAQNNPENEEDGSRRVPFARELYIERADFMEDAPKKFFRLAPGREVRLRHAYIIRCDEVIRDARGEVCELRCSIDPATLGSNPVDRKVKGVIHWVPAQQAVDAEIRLYDRLFSVERPDAAADGFLSVLNPDSLKTVTAKAEPALRGATAGESYQFERIGYFCADPDSRPEHPVFNRTVALRDSWAKQQA